MKSFYHYTIIVISYNISNSDAENVWFRLVMLQMVRPIWQPLRQPFRQPFGRVIYRKLSVEAVQTAVEPIVHTLEAVRASTHLSWPVFIPLATVALRISLTTPLAVWNRRRIQKQRELAPILAASVPVIKAQLASQVVAGRATLTPEQIIVLASKERRKRRIALYKEFNCQNWKMLLLPAVQIPVFVAMSFAVRALAGFDLSAVSEFGNVDTSQFWWFRNIVEPDPYGVLPLTLGACSLANVEMNTRTVGANSKAASVLATASRAGAMVFMAFSFHAPLALQLYWVSSNAFSLVQNAILMPKEEVEYPPILQKEILPSTSNEPAPTEMPTKL